MSDLLEEVRLRRRMPSPAVRRAIREAAGVTQQRIADEIGVHRMTVARWESGARQPKGADASAYAALLEQLREVAG